jgi:hypothetical protein
MIALNDKLCTTKSNAWGADSYSYVLTFKVEAKDAGPRDHYGGFNHGIETVREGDEINVYTDSKGLTCWNFVRRRANDPVKQPTE